MQRAPIVLTGTALGLAGVLAHHTASPSTTTSTASASAPKKQTTVGASSGTASKKQAASTTRSATGEDVSFQYGDLQVKVTLSGSRVSDVSVVRQSETDPRSQSIDEYALPELRRQAISAQGAQIDGVSGASYTSQAYEQSLQSALDELA